MSAAALLTGFDAAIGARIERAICAHHERRLRRRGHARAFDPPAGGWAESGAFAPRAGSRVEFLVDGAEVLPRMVEDIRSAKSHVNLAGWFFTPSFRMGAGGPTLRELLADAAQRVDVRVFAWAGAPLPLFRPDRDQVRAVRDELTRGRRIRVHLDAKERPLHCHHEKLVLVDDRVAYVGGIDLTDLSGNRFDASAHEPRSDIGWHDACLRLEGPIVADVAEHYRLRWPDPLPAPRHSPAVAAGCAAQLVRTVPERVYEGLRRGEFTILESYTRALRAAERLVDLESQFLWSPELVEILFDRLRDPPHPDFRVLVVLPAKPNTGTDDTRGQLGVLVDAAKLGGDEKRFLACTLFQPRSRIVYVHAKIGIVDDTWMTVGSANLNEHSLFNDTEVNVVVRDEAFIRAARLRLWEEHLEQRVDGDPCRIIDEIWRPLANESAHDRKLRLLRGVSRRTQALWGPINGLLVDG
jgi:phosphatidylserine/phosphatidylglycerophosphate/cardiolipin synthase-like enzyme